ncbi:hypothetical protein ASZ90_005455 [hydrocarbon metagenome]|uniref:CHAD domain-containing protein n=1 Tax=hydrocarbon metagenome TaxID=938273 RepID=A0A0W8FUY2_9ZZZZ
MNYKIFINEEINEAVKRVGIELLDDSISRLKNVNHSFDDSIHETRKNFKKMRALLRLIRFALTKQNYRNENILFRDTGRILSGIRDAAVMVETLDLIYKHFPDQINKDDYKSLRKKLSLRARRIRSQFKNNNNLIEAIINILDLHKTKIANWQLDKKEFDQIVPGLQSVYEQGFKAMNEAVKSSSSENYHRWRKSVKYLWYHVRILADAWHEYMQPLSEKLSTLSDLLGFEHDLVELRSLLIRESAFLTDKEKQTKLLNLIGQERLRLQTEAKLVAQYIYSESPENFVARINSYWNQSTSSVS